jgi:hypothetical protein
MRVEDLIQISMISLECLVIILRQGVEGGPDDVVLVEVGSVDVGPPFFMLAGHEVVDSPMELPKCVGTRIEQVLLLRPSDVWMVERQEP